jgi:hypothetical protein
MAIEGVDVRVVRARLKELGDKVAELRRLL